MAHPTTRLRWSTATTRTVAATELSPASTKRAEPFSDVILICGAARWSSMRCSASDHHAERGQGPLSPRDVQGLGEARRATSAYIERRASSCHKGRKHKK